MTGETRPHRWRRRGAIVEATIALRVALALAAAVCTASAAAGEIHRWKDAEGRIHYGDKPPAGAATKQIALPKAGSTQASPEVRVEKSVIRHYDIAGTTFRELNAGARASGPVSKTTGMRVWGQCAWGISWDYTRGGPDGKCALGKLSLVLSATIDMPRWTNRDAAPENLKTSWDRFYAALRAHEDGHQENGVRAANDLAKRLRALPPEKTCDALDRKINELGKRVMAEYQMLDQSYDRATGHGATQGAELK